MSLLPATIGCALTPFVMGGSSASFGSSASAAAYRAEQQGIIEGGQFLDALKMDVDATRATHGTAYDGAIQQMGEYVWTLRQ